jgi:hypothetical protein
MRETLARDVSWREAREAQVAAAGKERAARAEALRINA